MSPLRLVYICHPRYDCLSDLVCCQALVAAGTSGSYVLASVLQSKTGSSLLLRQYRMDTHRLALSKKLRRQLVSGFDKRENVRGVKFGEKDEFTEQCETAAMFWRWPSISSCDRENQRTRQSASETASETSAPNPKGCSSFCEDCGAWSLVVS